MSSFYRGGSTKQYNPLAIGYQSEEGKKKDISPLEHGLKTLTTIGQFAGNLGVTEAAGGAGTKITDPNLQPNKPLVQKDVKPFTPEEQGRLGLEINQKDSSVMNIGGPGTVKPGTVKTGTGKQSTLSDTNKPISAWNNIWNNDKNRLEFAGMLSDVANIFDPNTTAAQMSKVAKDFGSMAINWKGLKETGSDGQTDGGEGKKSNTATIESVKPKTNLNIKQKPKQRSSDPYQQSFFNKEGDWYNVA